jgi:hypothetical protein
METSACFSLLGGSGSGTVHDREGNNANYFLQPMAETVSKYKKKGDNATCFGLNNPSSGPIEVLVAGKMQVTIYSYDFCLLSCGIPLLLCLYYNTSTVFVLQYNCEKQGSQ